MITELNRSTFEPNISIRLDEREVAKVRPLDWADVAFYGQILVDEYPKAIRAELEDKGLSEEQLDEVVNLAMSFKPK